MGQNGSSPRLLPDTAMNRPLSPYPRTGTNGDAIVSEDETMVDASSASSVSIRRTSSSQRAATAAAARMASPGVARTRGVRDITTRQSRRSSLWCRVQSLRNRIYRTTRSISLINNSSTHSSGTRTSSSSSHSPNRRTIFGEPSSNRYSAMFGNRPSNPNTHTRPRPQSYHAGADPFVDNIDPRFEPAIAQRPQSSYSRHRSSSRPRSIWGASPSPPHQHHRHPLPPPPQPHLHHHQSTMSPRPLSTLPTVPPLPAVIDHSTQTSTINHPVQPFNITRRPGEDQAEMLSRFLYVAGAALAASLVESTDSTATHLHDFSTDLADATDEDLTSAPEGSFGGFLRALRQGRTQFAQALRNDSDPASGTSAAEDSSGSSFTYLLMYRFNALHSSSSSTSTTTTTTAATTAAPSPTLEALNDLDGMNTPVEDRPPTPMPSRRPSTASTTMSVETPSTTSLSSDRPSSADTSRTSSSSEPRMVPFVIIGVQPVPPRDSGHTTVPSFSEGVASLLANARQNATTRPDIRPTASSGSLTSLSNAPSLRGTRSIPLAATPASTIPGAWRDSPPPPQSFDPHRRRASVDGSFRHASNPSTSSPTRDREPNTRAWQMYIYGGAYPENHLIFTAPTLFTDVPSNKFFFQELY